MALVMPAIMWSCGGGDQDKIAADAYMPTTYIKGTSTNCAVVLRAQQGTSYSASVVSEGDWATFSNGRTAVSDVMATADKVIYLYFSPNASDVERSAEVTVEFADSVSYKISFTQGFYDASLILDRNWAELPVCKSGGDYIYNTHYGRLGANEKARNYTYCFDPKYRASIWVAYPLHSSHTSGSGDRDNSSFMYDPMVSTAYQANLAIGSYRGWYDRGHQIPAADRKCSQEMMDQTFYSTNMTPQQGNFNAKLWGALEGKVRNQICADTLYVVTGAWFEGEHHSSIEASTTDKSGNVCPTPTYYFKALLRTKKGNSGYRIEEVKDATQLRAIAFWMEHANTGNNSTVTSAHCISVAELEQKTGLELFPMIDDSIEEKVKTSAVPSMWGINN